MKDRRAVLFPHSYLPGSVKERILAAFEALTVCKPWYMEDSGDAESRDARIDIKHPPEDLRPPKDFLKLLAEYRLWMSQNPGYAFVPTRGKEDATWEIRQTLREAEKPVHNPIQEKTLQWHLILHLQRELEENHISADEMLVQVKTERSPLADALGEMNSSNGLLDDLSVSEFYPSMGARHLRQTLRAWFGLFGPSLPDDGILVTMAPDVLSYAVEFFGAEPAERSREGSASSLQRMFLPASSADSRMAKDPVWAGLSGKTLILTSGG